MSRASQKELGERLRACRKAAGLTGTQLGDLLGVSQSRISKVENGTGQARADKELISAWLDRTDADETTRHDVTTLLEATSEITDWTKLHSRGWHQHQLSYGELERSARGIKVFQNAMIPGLFQTAGYTSYLLSTVLGLSAEDVGQAVTARLQRKSVLYEPGTRIRVVLTEAVLRHRLGGPAVMSEQLHHLSELSRLPTVELGIIPIDTAMPSRYGASFDLFENLDGADDSTVVVELEASEYREDDPDRVAAYRRRHTLYWDSTSNGEEARSLIGQIADAMTAEIFR
ncbi:helix-turn-helix transcriptional regulator [Pseudonocardia sp. KRD291]|uniref:helix-turn-helix domain-containing protein n=1 Tax=Pseudonocardia sp. KRD291 TaxID=2792007 RepID=UPI001C4A4F10|nr:helix-turn-helix transcriptional regulator [Pseudonocardia sp. KRD291]MBW0102128.1 helix-turn-helix transcriptional regulator [Pseudonocardia sp. KRD291]